jgi:hypothetical protein
MAIVCPSGSTTTAEKGQTIVEFAVVVGFLLLLLFGIIDFSRLLFAYATMSNGVREGARYGIIHPDDRAGIEQRARAMMVLIGGEATLDVQFPGKDDDTDPGCKEPHVCRIVVIAESDFNVWTPVLPHMHMVAQATMHIE